MIGLDDMSKVVVGMVPLYVALLLGYGSVRWWRLFTPEQCDGINRFICLFILPLFSFDFTANVDPFHMSYRLIAADAISKLITIMGLVAWWFWARYSAAGPKPSGNLNSCVTGFSLSTLTNLLVVGVPVMSPMYSTLGVDFVVQLSVVQSLVWFPLLLMFLEFRKTRMESLQVASLDNISIDNSISGSDNRRVQIVERDIEEDSTNREVVTRRSSDSKRWDFIKVAGIKLIMNPNVIAVVLGVAWALAAHWLKFKMPSVIKGSVLILSRAGTGTAMFNIGIFMATQKKIIACGTGPTILGMVLRFIVGPAVMAFSSFIMGLHDYPFRIAIIQAALPQSITSFVYAKEYGLHANVISTAVVFGTLVSLPLLIGYYAVLQYVS